MKSQTPYKIIIIGGGAAGFFAALSCAEMAKSQKKSVLIQILESSDNILKKVKISGGGRCNVTHNCFDVLKFCENYPRGKKELISAMQRFQARDTVAWFASRGVNLVAEADGRMFPDTDSSQTVIDCFLRETEKFGIQILKNHSVQNIEKLTADTLPAKNDLPRFRIQISGKEPILANSVLIATGSSQIGYRLASELGHTITKLAPSLFSFKISDPLLTDLPGLSFSTAEVTMKVDVQTEQTTKSHLFKERGPILITHWGLSGPAILKISAWAAREMMSADYKATLQVNWLGLKNREEVSDLLKKIKAENLKSQVSNVYPDTLAKRFWLKILDRCEIYETSLGFKKWADLSNAQINKICDALFSYKFSVEGKNRYKDEFVECGGVNLKEIDFKKMESKLLPGLFFAGEILDIDGITGGFNFQNAWTGGWIAGQNLLS